MRFGTRSRCRVPSSASIRIVACLALGLIGAPPRAMAQPASAIPPQSTNSSNIDSLAATVRSIDIETGALELITGVGYALRIVRLQLPVSPAVKATSAQLHPGDIVRVRFRTTTAERVAIGIETLRFPERR